MSDQPSLDFGKYKGQPIKKVPTRLLKRYHGEKQGRNTVIADELRRRGLNSTELRELEWAYSQKLWRRSARKATVVRAIKRSRKRTKKRRQYRERVAERRIEARRRPFARIECGNGTVQGERQEASGGAFPSVGDGLLTPRKDEER